jgi:N-acylneuraminate cytidylyltransferase
MRTIALIPAREGSKGIPGKNIRHLKGRPLISYSIEAARRASLVDRVIVSTDSDEIAEIAAAAGSEVVRRPGELADDSSPMLPVVLHALDRQPEAFEIMTLLQPTCPFRRPEDVDRSISMLRDDRLDAVVGVMRLDHSHPSRTYRRDGDYLVPVDQADAAANRQDLAELFQRNGAIYTLRCSAIRKERTLLVQRTAPLVMDEIRSINIDNPFDWTVAEAFAGEHLP